MAVSIYDPHANSDDVDKEFGIKMVSNINHDVIILTVAHDEFIKLDLNALKIKMSLWFMTSTSFGH